MPKAIPTPPGNGHTSAPGVPTSGKDPLLAAPDEYWDGRAIPPEPDILPGSLEQAFQATESPDPAEMERLIAENSQLREVVADLRRQVEATPAQQNEAWAQQQREYESLLEEKSELIRTLHLRIQDLEARQPIAASTPKEEELQALNEELERERCRLEQDRRQLDEDLRQFREDEEIMTQQMRDMEVQMARERAELARQSNDLQRLLDDIRHELQRAERDRVLNERLVSLRTRFQDMNRGRSAPIPASPPTADSPAADGTEASRRDSGLFRRFFGGNE